MIVVTPIVEDGKVFCENASCTLSNRQAEQDYQDFMLDEMRRLQEEEEREWFSCRDEMEDDYDIFDEQYDPW